MPTHCKSRWLDVFVTKPEIGFDKQEYTFDDQFVCSVQSVRIDHSPRDLSTPENSYAIITSQATDWIMPTWTKQYETTNYNNDASYPFDAFHNIQVGDLIRIGGTVTSGYTDYLTVIEKIEVDQLYNATSNLIPTTNATTYDLVDISTTPPTVLGTRPLDIIGDPLARDAVHQNFLSNDYTKASGRYLFTTGTRKSGIAHYCLRVNQIVNCTALPDVPLDASFYNAADSSGAIQAEDKATTAKRNLVTSCVSNASRPDEKNFFPMYAMKNWLAGTTLRAALDHGVKQVSCIKLVGYALANKRQVGIHHGHEVVADDYIVLRIKEIKGQVVSNNRHANGAFAVLHCGSTSHNEVGAVEFSMFNTVDGIVVQDVDATNSVLRNLTLEVTDRQGKAAHFGRLHIWFKLLVTHG